MDLETKLLLQLFLAIGVVVSIAHFTIWILFERKKGRPLTSVEWVPYTEHVNCRCAATPDVRKTLCNPPKYKKKGVNRNARKIRKKTR